MITQINYRYLDHADINLPRIVTSNAVDFP